MKQATLEEKSAGGVVYRVSREFSNHKFSNSQIKYEFLIGKHSGYHKWVLPKGHIEAGETEIETATREVEEELGVKTKIISLPAQAGLTPLKIIEYDFVADLDTSGDKTKIHKQVVFYLMEVENDLGKEGLEMEERKWVSFEEGMKLLAFESEREVFKTAGKILKCL